MIFNIAHTPIRSLPVLEEAYPQDVSVHVGQSATFQVVIARPGKPGDMTFQWYYDGAAVEGATEMTYTRQAEAGSHKVSCLVTTGAGTVLSRTATLTAQAQYIYNEGIFSTISGFNTLRAVQSNTDILRLTSEGNVYCLAYSREKIDVTHIRAIRVRLGSDSRSFHYTTNYYPSFAVSVDIPGQNHATGAVSGLSAYTMLDNSISGSQAYPSGTFTLDVSSITGSVYLVFVFAGTSSFSGVLNIESIESLR